MRVQLIVYTKAMEQSVAWYSVVLDAPPAYRSEVWTSFDLGDAFLALHRVDTLPAGSKVALSLVATEPLEEVVRRLAASDLDVRRGIQDDTFGRSILLEDPDGLAIQVNEHH